ncbi:WD40/YVTN/BNR-like repeat-containing protein [Actinocorallia populi]|uniref:WD40/YVTN/BNR-like repeat-containing protein n=1 Tax=Actinocorallia populi TaxID=2079200 RepID=UPI000D096A64|nr:sialidase family protein [Actinocorallia populi]
MSVLLAIGTVKGLFLARSEDRRTWEVAEPRHPMSEAYSLCFSGGRLLAGLSDPVYGPVVSATGDLGATWTELGRPVFPDDTGTSLERVWQLAEGPTGRLYAGTQPSALFTSDDGGRTFALVRALWDHPHRPRWEAGFGGQAVHTVLPHPHDPDEVLVAMSTGGVYLTRDGGASWTASNTGVQATFLPERHPEFGQCVHKVARDCRDPQRLYLQNHEGVYRSDDGGAAWKSIAEGLPGDFGFAMVAHPHRSGVIYTFPVNGDERGRYPYDRRCRVFRSEDAGSSWEALTEGLPREPFYQVVLRDAMCADDADPAGVYFGTRSGEVFASGDEGGTWTSVAAHLPAVCCVRAAVV